MVRHRETVRSPAKACIVGTGSLGSRYLGQLLKSCADIQVLEQQAIYSTDIGGDGAGIALVLNAEDLNFPVSRCVRTLRTRFPQARMLAVVSPISEDEQCQMLFSGIDGIIFCDDVEDRLAPAVLAVLAGRIWASETILSSYVAYARSTDPRRQFELTQKQQIILGLLERGLSNKEIADAMGISQSTVKFHLSNLFKKLNVNNRRAAAELGFSVDILTNGPAVRNAFH